MDTLTLPWRRRRGAEVVRLYDLASSMGSGGRKVAAAGLAMPLMEEGADGFLVDMLMGEGGIGTTSLMPFTPKKKQESSSLEGLSLQAVRYFIKLTVP